MATQTVADRAAILRPSGLTPLLSTEELAAYYGVKRWTVNEWVKAGCPVAPIAMRGRRFDLDDVKAWHAEQDPEAARSELAATA